MSAGRGLVGWVVDAQVDFMDPKGRLYIKDLQDDTDVGCVQIVDTLRAAVAWMRANCDALVFTGDWHGLEDEEIDAVAPDPGRGTYPPHCMGRSEDEAERAGAQVIAAIRPEAPIVLEMTASEEEAKAVARRAVTDRRPVFIRKNRFDVFVGNASTEAFVEGLRDALEVEPRFVVVGVARDVCVTQAVDGMQARGYDVTAVSDATWGLGLEPEMETLTRWSRAGRVLTLAELVGEGDAPAG